jgi:hypothetical protein
VDACSGRRADALRRLRERRSASATSTERSFASAEEHGWSEFEKGMADGFQLGAALARLKALPDLLADRRRERGW